MGNYKLQLERSWEEVKEDLKENNIYLTDEDLDYQPGEEDQLLERLEKKMNKSKAEIKALIESISSNQGKGFLNFLKINADPPCGYKISGGVFRFRHRLFLALVYRVAEVQIPVVFPPFLLPWQSRLLSQQNCFVPFLPLK